VTGDISTGTTNDNNAQNDHTS